MLLRLNNISAHGRFVIKLIYFQLQEELIRLGLPNNVTMHLRDYRMINPWRWRTVLCSFQ